MERGVLVSPVRVEHSTFVVWNIAVWKHNVCQRKVERAGEMVRVHRIETAVYGCIWALH